jgi:hypothetical protein
VFSAGMRQSCSGENGNQQEGMSQRKAKSDDGQSLRFERLLGYAWKKYFVELTFF